ncbi:MAG: arginase family protein [Candidatus Bathyarchaeota archaeon]|nr:arginase family protein [Candidatus Bathyarchaeota archaeon]
MSKIKVGIPKLTYSGHLGRTEQDEGPKTMEEGGLLNLLKKWDCEVVESKAAKLTAEEEKVYGARYRLGLASNHLADIVANQIKTEVLPIGLLANCNGLMGMLAGHQRAGPSWKPLRVGLVWIDAHGDFNTPETSLSGMMGGMPVAISTGLCLHHVRRACGLDPPLPMKYVTMVGVRDTDPWEQHLIDTHNIPQVTVPDLKNLTPKISEEMERLASVTDIIYIHVDLDILDPDDIPGAGLPVENGPTADELGEALEIMFRTPKAKGFGMASYPWRRDTERRGLKSVYRLVEGVIKGVKNRE